MTNRVLQRSFTGGEIAPQLLARTDDSSYQSGARTLENFIVLPQGAIRARAGFRYVGETDSTYQHRLIPFRFSSTQTLVLVFGQYTMQVIKDGAFVLNPNGTRYTLSTPYSAEDLFSIDYSQNADIMTLCCNRYPPKELRRYGATDWRIVDVATSPVISAPIITRVTANYPSNMTDAEIADKNKITCRYKVTAIDENGIESVGSGTAIAQGNYYITGSSMSIYFTAVSGAKYYRLYRSVSGVFGFLAQIDSDTLVFNDTGANPDTSTTPPRYDTPFSGSASAIASLSITAAGKGYGVFNASNTIVHTPNSTRLNALPFIIQGDLPCGDNIKYVVELYNGSDLESSQEFDAVLLGTVNSKAVYMPPITIEEGEVTSLDFDTSAHHTATLDNAHLIIYAKSDSGKVDSGTGKLYCPLSFGTISDADILALINSNEVARYIYQNFQTKSAFYKLAGYTASETDYSVEPLALTGLTTYQELFDLFPSQAGETTTLDLTFTGGNGAVGVAYATDGIITAVSLTSGGSGYTSSVVSITSDTGFGGSISATVSSESQWNYPRTTAQFDQRRVFAGTNSHPLKVWFTNAGQQNLMMYHVPVLSDDRIDITAVTMDADIIKHAVGLDSLILFTGSSEMRVFTQNSDMLSPSSIAVRAQSYVGASDVQPVIANATVLYAASRGGHVRGLGYDYTVSGYTSSDICIRAPHLFDGFEVKDLAYAKSPVQVLWVASSSGQLLGCTYYPDQQVLAWHHHKLFGSVESVCTVSEGEEDHLYVITNHNGTRLIQRMANIQVPNSENNYRYLDCYLDTVFGSAQTVVTGLDHLEGQTVAVFVDGKQQSNKVVENGSITLDTAGRNIAVGIPIEYSLVTVPIMFQAEADLQGRIKNICETSLRIKGEGNVKAGAYPNNGTLYDCNTNDIYAEEQDEDSKVVKVTLDGDLSVSAQVLIKHDDAFPLEIASVIHNIVVEGGK